MLSGFTATQTLSVSVHGMNCESSTEVLRGEQDHITSDLEILDDFIQETLFKLTEELVVACLVFSRTQI